jgi:hypothetical protein
MDDRDEKRKAVGSLIRRIEEGASVDAEPGAGEIEIPAASLRRLMILGMLIVLLCVGMVVTIFLLGPAGDSTVAPAVTPTLHPDVPVRVYGAGKLLMITLPCTVLLSIGAMLLFWFSLRRLREM